jgi:hypothetical protein
MREQMGQTKVWLAALRVATQVAQEGRLVVSRVALKYLLVTVFVSGIVAVIWLGHVSDHIKHVDYVPPPITAPAR